MKKTGRINALLSRSFIGGLLLLSCNFIYALEGGQDQLNSPLYRSKTYDQGAPSSSGKLPKILKNIGIEQKLGEQLPMDAELEDENGNTVKLQAFFQNDKPVIVAFVYYSCPMLCNEVLNGLTASLQKNSLKSGKDFEVVAISFDPRDTPEIARGKKQSYLERYGRDEKAETGWHFLTGKPEVIKEITEAAGFNYAWDAETEQYAHAGGIQIATPDGKMSRYFLGIDYKPQDLKFALMEASEKAIGTPTDQLLLYCYHYDPASGTYGLAALKVLRLAGVLTLLGFGLMFLIFKFYKREAPLIDN
jgi:protein SCO1/2